MTGQATSLQHADTWRQFASFLRRPELPERASGVSARAFPVLGQLLLLDVLLMTALIGIAALLSALGVKLPEHLLSGMKLTGPLIAFIIVGAPIGEEIIFRGWLSGRLSHIGATILLGIGVIALMAFSATGRVPIGLAVLAAVLVLAAGLVWWRRGRPPLAFFARHFRWFYYGSALAFGTVHLTNFAAGNALLLLPLTLPQLLLGLILGFARVRFGLWSSMLFHAVHNTLFISLVLLGMG